MAKKSAAALSKGSKIVRLTKGAKTKVPSSRAYFSNIYNDGQGNRVIVQQAVTVVGPRAVGGRAAALLGTALQGLEPSLLTGGEFLKPQRKALCAPPAEWPRYQGPTVEEVEEPEAPVYYRPQPPPALCPAPVYEYSTPPPLEPAEQPQGRSSQVEIIDIEDDEYPRVKAEPRVKRESVKSEFPGYPNVYPRTHYCY